MCDNRMKAMESNGVKTQSLKVLVYFIFIFYLYILKFEFCLHLPPFASISKIIIYIIFILLLINII